MIARLRSWWSGRSRAERLTFAVGVPAVAVAALWGNFQDRAKPGSGGTEAEGGEASAVSPATGAPAMINAGAPGVGYDQLASFSEVFTTEIGELEGRLGVIEGPGFADSPAIGAVKSQFETSLGTLEDELRDEIERSAASRTVNQPPAPAPAPKPVDELANFRTAVLNAYQTEGVRPPGAATITRLALEVKQGRSLQNLRASIRANERKQGRPTAADSSRYYASR